MIQKSLKKTRLLFLLLLCASIIGCEAEEKSVPTVKRTIKIKAIDTIFIELGDKTRYGMGENLYNRLVTKLSNSEKYILIVEEEGREEQQQSFSAVGGSSSFSEEIRSLSDFSPSNNEEMNDPSDRLHFRFPPLPMASFEATMKGLTYRKGSKGTSNFSGFNRDYRTPWNSGEFNSINEFPLRNLEFKQSWFGTSFLPIGSENDNTISGVNFGNNGEFNLIIFSIRYKRERFLASAQLRTTLKLLEENTEKMEDLEAHGSGYMFGVGANFASLEIDFSIAKKTALKETFDQAVELMAESIEKEIKNLPIRSRVEFNNREGIIIHAGRREGTRVGDIFLHKSQGQLSRLQAKEVFYTGSIVKVISGNSFISPGDVIVLDEGSSQNAQAQALMEEMSYAKSLVAQKIYTQKDSMQSNLVPDNVQRIQAIEAQNNIKSKKIYFDPPEFSLPNDEAQRALDFKINSPTFLLSRWKQYDQEVELGKSIAPPFSIERKAQEQENLAQISLANTWRDYFSSKRKGAKVAIIDSGVDYNHDNLHHAFHRHYVGWDFYSYDARPFDDNSHGTSIAGLIAARGIQDEPVGIAPDTQLLSYRIFNPYGETSSAAIYGAFEKAIQDGAKIIVAAWSTQRYSGSIKKAVELAKENGVLVITAAGDRGINLDSGVSYPASYGDWSNVITVAALNAQGGLLMDKGKASNYGRTKVSIAAPGFTASALAPRSEYLEERKGTGIAAAHVAGVASLILSLHPGASASELKEAILLGAQQDSQLNTKISRGRKLDASGAINAFSSL